MFEDKKTAPSESPVTIGRVIYCVILLLPIHNFLYLIFGPRFGVELGEGSMLLAITMIFFSLVLSIIGGIVILRRRSQQKSNLFWVVVTGVAFVPLVTFLSFAVFS